MSPRVPQIAARVLVALTLATAGLIAVLAFLPGTEVRYYNGFQIREAGGILIAVPALIAAAPGLFVWIETRPALLWTWTAVALAASLALYVLLDRVAPAQVNVVRWPARVVDVAVWALILSTVLGSYVLGFAIRASEPSPYNDAPGLARPLRLLVLGIAALSVVLLAVGFLPGQRMYHDANHCFGATLGTPWHTEHHIKACVSSFTELNATYPAGGELRLALYLLVVLVPAWPVYRAPRAQHAWGWFGAAIAGSVVAGNLMCWLELDIDFLTRTVTLWPVHVVELGVAAIQVVLLLGVPLLIARSQPARLPTARVVARK